MTDRFIVVGGGLAGLSAAHTILQSGGAVTLLERNAFMGGNSTKATSGINGAETRTQKAMGIPDTKAIFEEDTVRSATGVKKGPKPPTYKLAEVLTHTSGAAVEWIQDNFGPALDVCSRLGGHSQPRTHRSKNGTSFPGMEITYALMKAYEKLAETSNGKVKLVTKARVTKIVRDANGKITGAEYTGKDGKQHVEQGHSIVVASGGYGAGGLFKQSLLQKIRPDLCHLPTTNGEHCQGDGISFSQDIGASGVDLEHVQVHPTGLVHQDDPDNRVKFLAAEALRGEGGIILDKNGKRFCNDLGTRDYVTGEMWNHANGPYRLVLNETSFGNIAWHCKHYCGRRVMKEFANGHDVAKEIGISSAELKASFDEYNSYAVNNNDPWGKKFFNGTPLSLDQKYMVAVVTPVVHYTMGGLKVNGRCEVLSTNNQVIPGLYAAGEATGGVHGRNRLGGSALLECVALGRVAGKSAWENYTNPPAAAAGGAGSTITVSVPQPGAEPVTITIQGAGVTTTGAGAARDHGAKDGAPPCGEVSTKPRPGHGLPLDGKPQVEVQDNSAPAETESSAPAAAVDKNKSYSMEEVAKHKSDKDCWLVVNGEVLDVTKFLPDHPGGKMAIMAFAGRDASEEFNMVHEEGVIEKYAPDTVIGKLAPKAKL